MKCKICNSDSLLFGNALILKKNTANFYRCVHCDFIQTEEPYWLDESYSSAITKSDLGLLGRNISLAEKTRNFIITCLDPKQSYVDFGGGYGIFTRLMRDKGFDFYHYDPLCQNIFSQGFEAERGKKYSLVTAWEVFEHLVDPMSVIANMHNFSQTMIFTTVLLPKYPKSLDEWWYYGLEHGQHISFYSLKSIEVICEKLHLSLLYSDGYIHLLSDSKINPFLLKICFNERFRFFRRIFNKTQPASLLNHDFEMIIGKKITNDF